MVVKRDARLYKRLYYHDTQHDAGVQNIDKTREKQDLDGWQSGLLRQS